MNRPDDQNVTDTHLPGVVGAPFSTADHRGPDTRATIVGGGPLDPLGDQSVIDTHTVGVAEGATSPPTGPASKDPTPKVGTPDGWVELRIWAEMFHDAQSARIRIAQRVGAGNVDPAPYLGALASQRAAEDSVKTSLIKCYRRVVPPEIRDWQRDTTGIGDHLLARLLGHLGHPAVAHPHHWEGSGADRELIADEPFVRTVGQLWQYCGHGAPSRRRKGMSVDEAMGLGSPTLKMLVHLIAEGAIKEPHRKIRDVFDGTQVGEATWPYRHLYEKLRWDDLANDELSDGHQHSRALRRVGKEILRDLWRVSRFA